MKVDLEIGTRKSIQMYCTGTIVKLQLSPCPPSATADNCTVSVEKGQVDKVKKNVVNLASVRSG